MDGVVLGGVSVLAIAVCAGGLSASKFNMLVETFLDSQGIVTESIEQILVSRELLDYLKSILSVDTESKEVDINKPEDKRLIGAVMMFNKLYKTFGWIGWPFYGKYLCRFFRFHQVYSGADNMIRIVSSYDYINASNRLIDKLHAFLKIRSDLSVNQ